jgi:hypothetical protein
MAGFRLETKNGVTKVWDRYLNQEIENVVKVEFTHTIEEGPRLLITVAVWDPEIESLTPGKIIETTTLNSRVRSYATNRDADKACDKPVDPPKINFREFT